MKHDNDLLCEIEDSVFINVDSRHLTSKLPLGESSTCLNKQVIIYNAMKYEDFHFIRLPARGVPNATQRLIMNHES